MLVGYGLDHMLESYIIDVTGFGLRWHLLFHSKLNDEGKAIINSWRLKVLLL